MRENEEKENKLKKKSLPKYEPPQVKTYTGDELLKELGPAQGLTGGIPLP